MIRKLIIFTFCILISMHTYSMNQDHMKRTIQLSVATLLAGYAGYQWWHTPDNEVTQERLQFTMLNDETLNHSNYIMLFAHGIDLRHNTYIEQAQAYADATNLPTVTFTFGDSLRRINFAQETDMQCLHMAYNHVRIVYPNKKIILTGVSRGASAIIKFLTEQQKEAIHAVILESPWDTIQHLTHHIADSYLSYLPQSHNLLHRMACSLPNMNDCYAEVIEHAQNVHANIPMFIAYSTADKVVPPEGTSNIFNALRANGNTISCFALDDGNHGKLIQVPALQESIHNEFLRNVCSP